MNLLERIFHLYYRAMAKTIYVSNVSMREFMFRGFDGKVRRHISFSRLEDLREHLITDPPLHAYYSVSLYRNPTAPMEEKGPIKAELFFDIDSTDLRDEECEKDSIWRCKECGYTGKGVKPDRCPKCGSERIEVNHWLNERCISLAKSEVGKLVDVLSSDFGVDLDQVSISYTGNRGFHVRVTEGPLTSLGKNERREVAFYVMGKGFDPSLHLTIDGGRVAISTKSGVMRRAVSLLLSEPAVGMSAKIRGAISGKPVKLSSKDIRHMVNLLKMAASRSGAEIDWMVTMDTGRLTRIPNSLHGKTGFRALSLTLDDYKVFDPFKDSVGLPADPEISIEVAMDVPTFRLKGENFGPYSLGERVRLPGFAAAFLILRDRAKLLSD